MKKLIIIAILAGMLLAPLGAGVAFAQEGGGAVGYVAGKIIGAMGWHDVIMSVFADLGNIVLTIVSKVLNISGAILNASVELSIGRVGDLIEKVPIVSIGWTVFRDIANLCFIFILLWIGIRTILGLGGGEIKKLLLNVIIMALLINFSLFITKAIIDAGNIATLHFYDAMRPDLNEPVLDAAGKEQYRNGKLVTRPTTEGGKQVKAGLSDIYMEGLRLQSVMDARGGQTTSDALAAAGGFADNFIKVGLATILGSVFFLVAAFIFFAAALLFITRAVVLMFVMILAPLAFVAQVLPNSQAQSLANKWWHTLFSQTFFAPLYMALSYAVAKAIQSGGMAELLKIQNNEASFAALMTSESSGNIGIVINYLILIVAIAATLLIAKNMGAYGGSMVMGWGQGLRKWGQGVAGKNTLGRAAHGVMNSQGFKNFAANNPRLGLMSYTTLNKVASSPFGGKKGGYSGAQKQKVKNKVALGKLIGTGTPQTPSSPQPPSRPPQPTPTTPTPTPVVRIPSGTTIQQQPGQRRVFMAPPPPPPPTPPTPPSPPPSGMPGGSIPWIPRIPTQPSPSRPPQPPATGSGTPPTQPVPQTTPTSSSIPPSATTTTPSYSGLSYDELLEKLENLEASIEDMTKEMGRQAQTRAGQAAPAAQTGAGDGSEKNLQQIYIANLQKQVIGKQINEEVVKELKKKKKKVSQEDLLDSIDDEDKAERVKKVLEGEEDEGEKKKDDDKKEKE
ncbi:MAG: hypothetical protein UX81_C0002G0012 [Parcubacteria group bacterium GW2011_GWA2_47_12]|nr:MAG: hypothetical protein UX81_C0002G0012 [Parcubacteria group bacterium GW2011_GWA2_47_12]